MEERNWRKREISERRRKESDGRNGEINRE
jgi:hypothetical protein